MAKPEKSPAKGEKKATSKKLVSDIVKRFRESQGKMPASEEKEEPMLPDEQPIPEKEEEEEKPEEPPEAPAEEEITPEQEPAAVVERAQLSAPIPVEEEPRKADKEKVIDSYTFLSESIPVEVTIVQTGGFVPTYNISIPGIGGGTKLLLETKLRGELISDVKLDITEILDPKKGELVKTKFRDSAMKVLAKNFPQLPEDKRNILASYLIQNTLGMGELETPLHDEYLEEVVVNNSRDPVWVYHKVHGWCRTNLYLKNEEKIYDYSALVARKVGRQINTLSPLLDAHLPNGDRVNATLFPVSNFGNTITVRKFSRNPWTISNLIRSKTITPEVAATVWLAVQSELSLIVSGGTGSGKTSFLNALAGLIPANQRIISIEDTRELTLPSFLHWVPMVTREANPEGRGEVTMLDLMVNALRQRPDRIIVGEVRRQKEAEVLFEAMHTGHSVYATVHADNAEQTVTRLINPPINVPPENLDALAGIVVQYRHRRMNLRRTLEFAEVQKNGKLNTIYRWDSKRDAMIKSGKLDKIAATIELYSGLSDKEIDQEVAEKVSVLNWMVKNGYEAVNEVGSVVSNYYREKDEVLDAVRKNKKWEF